MTSRVLCLIALVAFGSVCQALIIEENEIVKVEKKTTEEWNSLFNKHYYKVFLKDGRIGESKITGNHGGKNTYKTTLQGKNTIDFDETDNSEKQYDLIESFFMNSSLNER